MPYFLWITWTKLHQSQPKFKKKEIVPIYFYMQYILEEQLFANLFLFFYFDKSYFCLELILKHVIWLWFDFYQKHKDRMPLKNQDCQTRHEKLFIMLPHKRPGFSAIIYSIVHFCLQKCTVVFMSHKYDRPQFGNPNYFVIFN